MGVHCFTRKLLILETLSAGGIAGIIVGVAVIAVIWGVIYVIIQRRKSRVQQAIGTGLEEKPL
jgi:hypothetical protein